MSRFSSTKADVSVSGSNTNGSVSFTSSQINWLNGSVVKTIFAPVEFSSDPSNRMVVFLLAYMAGSPVEEVTDSSKQQILQTYRLICRPNVVQKAGNCTRATSRKLKRERRFSNKHILKTFTLVTGSIRNICLGPFRSVEPFTQLFNWKVSFSSKFQLFDAANKKHNHDEKLFTRKWIFFKLWNIEHF